MAKDLTRREFLKLSALAGAGLTGAGSVSFGATTQPTGRPTHRLFTDLHVHALMDEWNEVTPFAQTYSLLARTVTSTANPTAFNWKRCYEAGVDALCIPHYNAFDEVASMPTDPNPHAPANIHRMMDMLEARVAGDAAPYATVARNHKEFDAILEVDKSSPESRMAVVQAIEGGHALGGDISSIEGFARRGVAYITMAHFLYKGIVSVANAFPFFPDTGAPEPAGGLTGFGREAIREMEDRGIIVDVMHVTSTGIAQILKEARRPLLASHGASRTLADRPYSLLDEHIVEIAGGNGLVGVVLFPYHQSNYADLRHARDGGSLRDIVRTIEHIVKICGTHHHVAVGSDFGGFITPPKEMKRVSQIGKLFDMIEDAFGSQQIAEDILANNAIRFLSATWRSGV